MPIFIPPVMSPVTWTENSWEAYLKLNRAEMHFIEAYRDTIGLFALFSRKKAKRLKDAESEYHRSREIYYKVINMESS